MMEIRSTTELDAFFEATSERPLFLFKHSTACNVSARAFRAYEEFVEDCGGEDGHAWVGVRENRGVSQEIAARTGIRHESPQAFLVLHGRTVWSASHFAITRESLTDALESVPS
jgi:bacillithiol system protein YtxJ